MILPSSPHRVAAALLALLLLLGCAPGEPAREDAAPMTPLRYLALGDSYTIGESVPEQGRWPVQLAARLREDGLDVEPPLIIARTGWTTDELDAGIDAAPPEGAWSLVSLLIGVNNQYRGRDPEVYRAELRALIQRAIAFAGGQPGHVFMLSFPDWGVMPFAEGRDRDAIAAEVDRFNAIGREEAQAASVAWVDITPISRSMAVEPGADYAAPDGLHPSAAQYTRWTAEAYPTVRALLPPGGTP